MKKNTEAELFLPKSWRSRDSGYRPQFKYKDQKNGGIDGLIFSLKPRPQDLTDHLCSFLGLQIREPINLILKGRGRCMLQLLDRESTFRLSLCSIQAISYLDDALLK